MNLHLKVTEIDSSTLSDLEWVIHADVIEDINKVTGHLRATFTNGTKYIYEDVPLVKVLAVMNPSGSGYSIGANFNQMIKLANYKYKKQ